MRSLSGQAILLFAVVGIGAPTFDAVAASPPSETPIKTVLPALRMTVRPEDPSGPGVDDYRIPELVLVVKKKDEVKRQPGKHPRDEIDETPLCDVKRVLYGSYAEKTIRFQWPGERVFWYWGNEEFVVALIPAYYREQRDYMALYGVPVADEAAETALSQARLDFAALASDCIFVGKEVSIGRAKGEEDHDSWNKSSVEIVRVIHGPAMQPGTKIRTVDEGLTHISNYERRAMPQPRIYFVLRGERNDKSDATYHVVTHLAVDQEAKVIDALKHGGQCVPCRQEESEEHVKCREVIFPAPTPAIELIGAENDAAVSLFYRTLVYRRKTSRPLVVAAIEREMLRATPARSTDEREFRGLKRLIDVLGDMQREDGGKDLRVLIEACLKRIEQGLPEPPEPGPARHWNWEYGRTDMNRSLVWLLMQFGEKPAQQQFGERLTSLRAKVQGRWKDEIQVAMNAIKLEDTQEVAAAMQRMRDVRPVRSQSGLRLKQSDAICHVRFSHNGKLLATGGREGEIRLWNTADWSLAAAIEQECSIDSLRFSPDDRFLYAAGGGGGLELHARFDTRTGKQDKAYRGHHKGIAAMELSADGGTMVTSSFYENVMYFWDTESGRILRTIPVTVETSRFFLSPDGKGIVRPGPRGDSNPKAAAPSEQSGHDKTKNDTWLFEPFRGETSTPVILAGKGGELITSPADPATAYRFYQDDSVFVFSGRPGHVVSGRWTKTGFQTTDDRDINVPGLRSISIANNGKVLAALDQDSTIHFFSLPSLQRLGKVEFPRHESRDQPEESLDFSPDGKLLAGGQGQPTPSLISTATRERLRPYDGHSTHVDDVFFSSDGKQLRSYGDDNTVCTWDAVTMKMLRRAEIPLEYSWDSIRPSDGRYATCYPRSTADKPFGGTANAMHPARLFDAETGQFIVDLPVSGGTMYWTNDHEAAMEKSDTDGRNGTISRFNYLDGKVISTVNFAKSEGGGELAEDGRSVYSFFIEYEGRATPAAPSILDLATGKFTARDLHHSQRERVNRAGLVPGGKYFYLADPNIYIYDRTTLKQVAKKAFDSIDILSLSFSQDGSRYALISGGRLFIEDVFKWYDPKTQSVVRIHDTLSGKTLHAFAASTRWARVKFSPDGRRLAVINDDGTIEVWPLPN